MSRNGTADKCGRRHDGRFGRGGGGLGGNAQRNGVGRDHVNELRRIEIGMYSPARHRVRTQAKRKACSRIESRRRDGSPRQSASV